ncbi:MAG: hypothetical protein QXP06_07385 [Candidatus Bathyarchaeia archaeon]
MSSELKKWIEKWRDDLFKSAIIGESIKLGIPVIETCNYVRKTHADIVLTMVQPEEFESILGRVSAYIHYNWDTMVDKSRVSLILALSALYNPAFCLLRHMLEELVNGAFFHGLALKKYRESVWVLPPEENESTFRDELIKKIKVLNLSDHLEENSVSIFDLIGRMVPAPHINELFHTPRLNFNNILGQVYAWEFLYPFKEQEVVTKITDMYNNLSWSVHQYPWEIDSLKRYVGEEEAFEQKPLRTSLMDFLSMWIKFFDLANVLSINIFRAERPVHETKAILLRLIVTDHYKNAQAVLPLTRTLIGDLLHCQKTSQAFSRTQNIVQLNMLLFNVVACILSLTNCDLRSLTMMA